MPPRTLTRLAAGLAALYLGWQAQARLPASPFDGALLYGLAIVLFVPALAHTRPALLPVAGPVSDEPDALSGPHYAGLAAALVLSVLGAAFFAAPGGEPTGWALHLLAVAAFAAPFVRVRHALEKTARPPMAWLPIAALLLLAAVPRFWQLDEFPAGTWYDEAFNGLAAKRIVEDAAYRPVFVEGDTLPAHFTHLLALSFRIFGVGTTSMRIVTALFGIATALLAYLVFRRIYGERIGWVAGALIGVMRFEITLSRISLHGITTPFFELLVLFFLLRALERRRLADVAWLALALGFGLAFYTPFRLFPLALAVFGPIAVVAHAATRRGAAAEGGYRAALRGWQRFAPHGLLVLAAGVFVATAPILQFALRNNEVFFARTANVSIFERRDQPDLALALWSNFSKHMLMFNVQGDRNGRHNLPNEPLLDPVTGALAVLGFALALRRPLHPPNTLMLAIFFVMNLGGILTVDFEAPQSLRSVGVVPALVYFAVLPLAALGAEVERVFARRPAPASAVQGAGRAPLAAPALQIFAAGLAVVVGAAALNNLTTYFVRQRANTDVWAAHSGAESVAAAEMNRLAADHDLIVTSLWTQHPTLRFLAPTVRDYREWTVNDRLPLVQGTERGVALVLDPLLKPTVATARRFYPGAEFRELKPPGGTDPAVYVVALTPDDARSVQGLSVRLYRQEVNGSPLRETIAANPLFDWTQTAPLTGTFSAEFRGTLFVPVAGAYRLRLDGAPDAPMWLDEFPATDTLLDLAKGNHSLRIWVRGGPRRGVLQWRAEDAPDFAAVPADLLFHAPVVNSGLLGSYFRGADWSGTPAFRQVDSEINLYFHNIPLPRPYSIEWTGRVFAPIAGVYRFATESRDESHVIVAGQAVVNNGGGGSRVEGAIQLAQGWNDLTVRYADHSSHTHIQLRWQIPGGVMEIIPSPFLSPPMGQYPTSEEIIARSAPSAPRQPTGAPGVPADPVAPLSLEALATVGTAGDGPGQLREPRAIAVGEDGRIYVADTGNRRVQVLDAEGNFLRTIAGDPPFAEPFDLVVLPDDTLAVLDSEDGWIYRFDHDGKPLERIGGPAERFFHPRGLSVDASGNLYVADTGGSRIVKLAPDGRRLQVLGSKGSGRGQFIEPSDAAADASGYVFATDVPNRRIEVFAPEGRYLQEFSIPPANPFNGPHLAFAPDGTLFVTAPEAHTIQRYARDGALLGEWGGPGSAPGQFRLPTGITVHGSIVWVADTGNNRLQKWEFK